MSKKLRVSEDMPNKRQSKHSKDSKDWGFDERIVMFISGFFAGLVAYRILNAHHPEWIDKLDQTLSHKEA